MPIFFLFVAVILIVTGLNGNTAKLTQLVESDFKGDGKNPSFFVWIIAIFLIGALGYVKALKPLSTMFLVLVLVVILLTNGNTKQGGGFFNKFSKATGIAQ